MDRYLGRYKQEILIEIKYEGQSLRIHFGSDSITFKKCIPRKETT